MFNQIAQAIRAELAQAQFPDSWIEEVLTALEFGDLVGGWGGENPRKYRIAAMFSPALTRLLSQSQSQSQPNILEAQIVDQALPPIQQIQGYVQSPRLLPWQ